MTKLKSVEVAMNNPDKLNRLGKETLISEIAEEMSDEELDAFLKTQEYEK